LKLAADYSKDGPAYLPSNADDYRTVKDLIESGLFRYTSPVAGRPHGYHVYIITEMDDLEADELEETPKDKGEKDSKTQGNDHKEERAKKDRTVRIKEEMGAPKVKAPVFTTPVRKRTYSTVASPLDEAVKQEYGSESDLDELELPEHPYSLRKRKQ